MLQQLVWVRTEWRLAPAPSSAQTETDMRPQNALDWTAFVFLIIGAFSWGYFVTDVNILDLALEKIWDPLDDVVFVLIALSGLYWIVRVFGKSRR
jgi:uncharacterized membrane protein YuzA (DUF378 family)